MELGIRLCRPPVHCAAYPGPSSIVILLHLRLTVKTLQQALLHPAPQACGSCSSSAWRAATASPAPQSATCQVRHSWPAAHVPACFFVGRRLSALGMAMGCCHALQRMWHGMFMPGSAWSTCMLT